MAFTVEDFRDLLALLAQHPEWRAELRREVLSVELLQLPDLVRRTAESVDRLSGRIEALTAHAELQAQSLDQLAQRMDQQTVQIEQLTERMDQLAQRMDQQTLQIEQLTQRMERVEQQLQSLTQSVMQIEVRLGAVEGEVLELRYARRAPAYFSRLAQRLRVMETSALADLLDDAVAGGRLTDSERETLLLTDLVLSGRRRTDNVAIYLVAEISMGIRAYDVERAADRAALLQKLGRDVIPVVAGRQINAEAAEMASERGVWHVLEGRAIAPLP
ncbi:MAG: hypothetical protein ACKVVP_18990 [Chloroflexota bacterium]